MSKTELSAEARCQLSLLKAHKIIYSENEELKARGLIHSDTGTITELGYKFDPYKVIYREENNIEKALDRTTVAYRLPLRIKKDIVWDYLHIKDVRKIAFRYRLKESVVRKVIKKVGL